MRFVLPVHGLQLRIADSPRIYRHDTAVLNDQRKIFPVSTCVRGIQGVTEDVFLSMPCSLGASGVRRIVDTPMTATESKEFREAASTIWDIQKDIWGQL